MPKKKSPTPETGQNRARSSTGSQASQPDKITPTSLGPSIDNPNALTPATVLQLQRKIGNQSVTRLLAAHHPSPLASPSVQRLIISYLDNSAGHFEEMVDKKIIPALYKNEYFGKLLHYAKNPKYKLNVIFDIKSGQELDQMEKGASKGAAVTGIYFVDETLEEKIDRLDYNVNKASSKKEQRPEPEKKVDETLNLKSIQRLRDKTIDIKIIINADTALKQKPGEAAQIITHEYIVHAMKYLALIEKIRNPELTNQSIQEELKQGYTLNKQSIFKPELPQGALHALKQHLLFSFNQDTDYEKAKEILKPVLKEQAWQEFLEREESDKTEYMEYVKTMLKFI